MDVERMLGARAGGWVSWMCCASAAMGVACNDGTSPRVDAGAALRDGGTVDAGAASDAGTMDAGLRHDGGVRGRVVMIVTHTTGFRHSSIPTAEAVLARIGREKGLFDARFCRTADDVAVMLTPAGLVGVDAVFFANTTGNLGVPNLAAFLDWIRGGGAFLGAHSASDTYHDERAYIDMLGGEFDAHGEQVTVEARVENAEHPAAAAFGAATWSVFDEIYRIQESGRARVSPLLTLPRYPMDGLAGQGEPADLMLAWFKSYGAGRVFYTALGHREDVWESAPFQRHLEGALRWALGGP